MTINPDKTLLCWFDLADVPADLLAHTFEYEAEEYGEVQGRYGMSYEPTGRMVTRSMTVRDRVCDDHDFIMWVPSELLDRVWMLESSTRDLDRICEYNGGVIYASFHA